MSFTRKFFTRRFGRFSPAPPPTSYSFVETFEGSTPDSLGQVGYDNAGWTSSAAGNNPHYATAPAPLVGSFSLRMTTSTRTISRTVTSGLRSVYFLWNTSNWNTSNVTFGLRNSAARIAGINTASSGQRLLAVNGTVVAAATGAVLNTATTYHVWFDYTPSTGADDGIARIYVSTDGIKGAVYSEVITGDATAEADELIVGGLGTTSVIWDNVIWNTSVIGSNPLG